MSILLAQLGDVHVKELTDCAIRRAPRIGTAIASEITNNTASVVLAICGDVTYSGTVDQFGTAKILFDSLEKELRDRCSDIGLVRVVVPGNHDCDLSGDQDVSVRKVSMAFSIPSRDRLGYLANAESRISVSSDRSFRGSTIPLRRNSRASSRSR